MTLVEVLVAASIFAFCLAGLLLTYMDLFILTDMSRDSTIANNLLQAKMEELKSKNFSELPALNNTNFDVEDSNFLINGSLMVIGKGKIYISNVTVDNTTYSGSDLREARVVISFKSRNRVIGEDKDLDGILDAGEDDSNYLNGTGILNSPVEGVTLIKNFTNATS